MVLFKALNPLSVAELVLPRLVQLRFLIIGSVRIERFHLRRCEDRFRVLDVAQRRVHFLLLQTDVE